MGRLLRSRALWVTVLACLYLLSLGAWASPYLFGPSKWQWHSRPPSPVTYPHRWPALLILPS